jgi:cell division protein FtsI (penicillin-binding protein 3)
VAGRAVRARRVPSFKAGSPRRRLIAVVVAAGLVLAGLIGRVAMLQTLEADEYRAASIAQRRESDTLKADRGVIFYRNGDEIAMSVPSSTVYADPALVVDPVATAATLTTMLGLSAQRQAELTVDLADPDSRFVYVARQIDEDLAASIDDLGLAGVGVYEEPKRVLPGGESARAIVGRTDPDGVGTAGLELQYDDVLTGVDGVIVRDLDSKGRSIPTGQEATMPATPGDDLVLTLDRSIQFQVQQALLARTAELSAKGGTAIVMDTDTGEIIALVSVKRRDDGTYTPTVGNPAATEAYEPGSVAKVISIAAALNEGVATPDTVFTVPYKLEVDDFEIKDAYLHETEPMTVRQIMVRSSNMGTVQVVKQTGTDRQVDYMRAFGFGEQTALDFPGESKGILKDADHLYGTERMTVAYGYGFAATPLQLVSAVNVVANGGEYVAPKLVLGTIGVDGATVETPPSPTRTVLRPEVADQMTSMMTDVVCQGTATLAQIPGITVAGKTGTGYKAQDNGTYEDDEGNKAYFASFVGFLPAEDPKVTILVSIDEPDPTTQDRFGGRAAAPVFRSIAEVAIHELKLRPPASGGCPTGG